LYPFLLLLLQLLLLLLLLLHRRLEVPSDGDVLIHAGDLIHIVRP
jgi:hypothetical protein